MYKQDRIECTKRRKDILEGDWSFHLIQHIGSKLGLTRLENMGIPSKSINLFKSIVDQISVLYDREPVVRNDSMDEIQASYLDSLDLFQNHGKLNKYVVGLRECFIKIDWFPGDHLVAPGIHLRIVTPDHIHAESEIDHPTVPYEIKELRHREYNEGGVEKEIKCWDVYSIEEAENPYFKIMSYDMKNDLTALFMEPVEYPYITPDGRPYLPYVLYHASESTCLFSPYELEELVESTLDIALDWSFWTHCLLQASWIQRYTVDLALKGLETKNSDGETIRQEITVAPNTMLQFESNGDRPGSVNTLAASIDPQKIAESIRLHVLSIAETLGFVADVQQGPVSGVSITLRKDSIREAQKKYTKQFKNGDEELLEKVALINNLYNVDIDLPVDGYSITYPSVPMSYEELTSRLDYNLKLLQAGLISKERILQEMYPDENIQDMMMQMNQNMNQDQKNTSMSSMAEV